MLIRLNPTISHFGRIDRYISYDRISLNHLVKSKLLILFNNFIHQMHQHGPKCSSTHLSWLKSSIFTYINTLKDINKVQVHSMKITYNLINSRHPYFSHNLPYTYRYQVLNLLLELECKYTENFIGTQNIHWILS